MSIKLRDLYETGNKVNDDPIVVVSEDFLSDLEVEQLLAAGKSKLKQALVSDAKSGVESAGRSGSNFWFRECSYQLPGTVPVRKQDATPPPSFKRVI